MSPLVVDRVCAKERPQRGPFTDYCNLLDASDMPTPARDFPVEVLVCINGHRFGFLPTQEPGLGWFSDDDRELLREADFVVRRFMCPPGTVFIGDAQVAFDLQVAIEVDCTCL